MACLFFVLLLAPGVGEGEAVLPKGITTIEADTFAGDISLRDVTIPEGVSAIGERAFADCAGLKRVVIPDTVCDIAEDAFAGVSGPMLFRLTAGSAPVRYALSHGIDFQADTVYRALLIGNSNYTSMAKLPGAQTDVDAMARMLTLWQESPYQVTRCGDLTASGLAGAIQSVFGEAKEEDVSLLFFSGHGGESMDESLNGALMGVDGSYTTASGLRSTLNGIKGRKIVIVDACYSGAFISRSAGVTTDAPVRVDRGMKMVSAFMQGFTAVRSRSENNLAEKGYYVLAAAHSSERSSEYSIHLEGELIQFGVFSWALCRACGYDLQTGSYVSSAADRNGDGVITIQEAYTGAVRNVASLGVAQTAQVWPENCDTFGFLR